jgi:hypothetical protein
MVKSGDFNGDVRLPPGLSVPSIRKAIEYIERELAEWVDLYFEQANIFSAVVGMFGTKALDAHSVYEKHRHADTAQQRFPDLKRKGSGPNPRPNECLESKGSKRPWQIQSHYDHPGWYIVWRYLVDPTEGIEAGRPILIWRVDVVFLDKADWKYESSTASADGGGRTHTFGVRSPAAKLRNAAVYRRSDITLRDGKPVARNGD